MKKILYDIHATKRQKIGHRTLTTLKTGPANKIDLKKTDLNIKIYNIHRVYRDEWRNEEQRKANSDCESW
jgi:hypothetical protein|tara:strand:+ start:73 stop:282 length:210 start_codon:yes stop_codon:yes gene_type:complete